MTPKALVQNYCWYWRLRYGEPYTVAWAKHQAVFKRLLGIHEARNLTHYIAFYLNDFVDRFSEEKGHPVELFAYKLPEIIVQFKRHEAQQKQKDSNWDYERILEARRHQQQEEE